MTTKQSRLRYLCFAARGVQHLRAVVRQGTGALRVVPGRLAVTVPRYSSSWTYSLPQNRKVGDSTLPIWKRSRIHCAGAPPSGRPQYSKSSMLAIAAAQREERTKLKVQAEALRLQRLFGVRRTALQRSAKPLQTKWANEAVRPRSTTHCCAARRSAPCTHAALCRATMDLALLERGCCQATKGCKYL